MTATATRVDEKQILARMNRIKGWFSDAEAELAIHCAQRALTEHPDGRIVEIGSFLGRSTVVLASVAKAFDETIVAIDPHEGTIDEGSEYRFGPTHMRFLGNMRRAEVLDHVDVVKEASHDVEWDEPISLVLIDGKHDYDSVRSDFEQFGQHLVIGGIVMFHDYGKSGIDAPWGVTSLVDQIGRNGGVKLVGHVESLVALERAR